MKKYTMLITLEVDLGEFENDQDAAECADSAAGEFMDAYIVDDTELCEVGEDGVRIRFIEF
jgi:hypothetical protein